MSEEKKEKRNIYDVGNGWNTKPDDKLVDRVDSKKPTK